MDTHTHINTGQQRCAHLCQGLITNEVVEEQRMLKHESCYSQDIQQTNHHYLWCSNVTLPAQGEHGWCNNMMPPMRGLMCCILLECCYITVNLENKFVKT